MEILTHMIGRRVEVSVVDSEEVLHGFLRGIDEGFVIVSERNDTGSQTVAVDRDSVWCITTIAEEVKQ